MLILTVGCGSIGARHVRNLDEIGGEYKLLVYDSDITRARALADERRVEVCTDLQAAMEAADAVIVATPTHQHLPVASRAVAEGCHVFIEKPLSHTTDGIGDLIEKTRTAGLVAFVASNMRFHHGPATLKAICDEGRVGRAIAATFDSGHHLPSWNPHRDYRVVYSAKKAMGGGVLLDGIHEVDLALWMFGPVRDVFCIGGKRSDLEVDVEDCVDLLLRSDADAALHIHLDYIQLPARRYCRIVGLNGTAIWDIEGQEVRVSSTVGGWESIPEPVGYSSNDMYVAEMEHFLACLRGDARPVSDLQAGRDALEIVLAAKRSMAGGNKEAIR